MSHVHLVVIVFESHLKRERVVRTSAFPLHRVLVVADVFSGAVPANTSGFGGVLCGVEERLLTLVVRTVWLDQIYYVEFVPHVLPHVAHFEVVPLSVRRRPVVVLQYQVVCVVTNHEGSAQIS